MSNDVDIGITSASMPPDKLVMVNEHFHTPEKSSYPTALIETVFEKDDALWALKHILFMIF